MMKIKYIATCTLVALASGTVNAADAVSVEDAFKQGTVKLDARLRYEMVDQDNALKDADALTLRTRLTLSTATYQGFSGLIEFEDSREVFGLDDYNDTNGKGTEYSVVADPNTTELDQAFIRYQYDMATATVGRQVVALDNQRFIGHVGWRQDRQTFDAARLALAPTDDIALEYVYINQRNRIFAEEKDVDSKDHALNASWKTEFGKLSGYAYLLDNDDVDNDDLDTYGVRFAGGTKLGEFPLNYQLEYASQENDANDADTSYYLAEVGSGFMGVNAKLGYEVLGSDDGKGGFSTPLATLHKFNGWADQFLSTPADGLQDIYVNLSTKALYGTFTVVYHDFSADESGDDDDFGSELDLSYATKFAKHYNAGIKYAMYDAKDIKVDADKLWVWVGASF